MRSIHPIEGYMLAPLSSAGTAGYVPLCAALQWIMTDGGIVALMHDEEAWKSALKKLWPLITGGEIELNGVPRGGGLAERIPAAALTVIKVIPPLCADIGDCLLDAPARIFCSHYIDEEHWSQHFNDQLFVTRRPGAEWTHLQVPKIAVLRLRPRPEPRAKGEQDCRRWLVGEMQAALEAKPKSKEEFWTEAKQKFPLLSHRQFTRAWESAIIESGAHTWSKSGRLKSNRCGN